MLTNYQKYFIAFLTLFISYGNIFSQNTPEHDLIISVERIWDRAAHNAFTSMINYNGKLYCTFRESDGHVSDINGTIRVIASDDGQNWYSVAHIFEPGVDLRDPQLSVSPDNRIMLNIGGSIYTNSKLVGMEPKVSFSDTSGMNFSPLQKIFIDEKIKSGKDWLWRATWHNGKSYATIYQPTKEKSVQLIVSNDGINYKFITTFDVSGGNETTLRFTPANQMIAVVRRDKEQNGNIGISEPPYKTWEWNELESRLGGPDLILLGNDIMICATREYPPDHNEQTILAKVEINGKFTKLLTLPSGGDCSYPGLVIIDDILNVSYYSSHEEKTAIYLAKILDLKYGYDSFEKVSGPKLVSDKNGIVKLSCEDKQAKIIYTLDGSVPTIHNSYN
ncbi:MAG: chitobiase/beta-hexosaminidase C-terminal domain-containing protein, partial [Bacteroidales bacterium]|nr:chitobiase/beta-hexosaminidase C-terminal domain-containing protein [Bacteroidales bacterium]